ncbi:type II toxin-antitoxin system PrlF family antitoxin [Jiella sp. MQZ9-1]|uniref:Type II toxin-antitoxin system PrlF family antitoxin n=1 Tax=Jiella flava TaxID=2816857 RepID=A0A939FXY0_9HYPH|nr:type II toxin-antitoxin system PrlF family antitoxin [Jiella flava]MBO0664043.1 type II toxin-antitoxin system PrlF family antitoxin [Jiella flava]MCD2472615.1 type II toxin-antitoxin system PrlF family antitoxin [Jiella flava]
MGHQSKLTAKGQTTIPLEVREHLKLKPGDRIAYVLDSDGGVRLVPKNRSIGELAGILANPRAGAGATLQAMDDAIGDYLADEDERIRRDLDDGRS